MIRSLEDLRTRLGEIRGADRSDAGPRVALVSTLGALHDGHVDLIREARERADVVVVSTFVNPLRFRSADDTAAYPRSPESDARVLGELGVDVVFAPSAAEFLPRERRRPASRRAMWVSATRGVCAPSTSTGC